MKAFNRTAVEPMVLTEGSLYEITDEYTIEDVAQDISAGSFVMNLLDKEGGSILDTVTVAFVTDGTDGLFKETFTIAELDTLIAAGTIPGYYELFFSDDASAARMQIYWRGPVEMEYSGD